MGSGAFLVEAIDQRLRASMPGQWMILQVHDELVFEVDEDRVEEVGAVVAKLMREAYLAIKGAPATSNASTVADIATLTGANPSAGVEGHP